MLRLGTLSLALLVALGLTGLGYAAWSDTATFDQEVKMGNMEVVLTPGEGSSSHISCSLNPGGPHTLVITLTNAGPGTYTCDFTIDNTGTWPVRIQDIFTGAVSGGVDVSLSGVGVGDQIEQAGVFPDSASGTVTVTVPPPPDDDPEATRSFTFNVAFKFVQWNLYVE